jgi:hypothetical protein
MIEIFGTYGGHLAGFGGFLCGIAAVLYTRVRVGTFARSVADIDWQVVSEIAMDVQKLKKSAQKWTNNENSQVKLSTKEMMEKAYLERLLQQQNNVQPIRKVEM